MKKAITILTVFAMAVSFTACAGRDREEETEISVIPQAERETVTAEIKPNESGVAASGENKGAQWVLYNDGALEIAGYGKWEKSAQVLEHSDQIKKIRFGDGITAIGKEAFAGCKNLKDIVLPESMQAIEAKAFSGCNVQALNLGKNVSLLAADAFDECEITNVKISTENAYYSTDRYGVVFNKTKTELVLYSDGFRMNSYIIPSTVEKIGSNAFLGNDNLVGITLPESLKEIGAGAFADCENLRELNLPLQITVIGASAFENCTSLKAVAFPDKVQVIGEKAFAGCMGITTLDLPKSVTTVGAGAFAESVEEVNYAGSKTAWSAVWVGENAFVNASVNFGEKSPQQ